MCESAIQTGKHGFVGLGVGVSWSGHGQWFCGSLAVFMHRSSCPPAGGMVMGRRVALEPYWWSV